MTDPKNSYLFNILSTNKLLINNKSFLITDGSGNPVLSQTLFFECYIYECTNILSLCDNNLIDTCKIREEEDNIIDIFFELIIL
jgi:hypothetical protein